MTIDKFDNKYRIPTARAIWHDYTCGLYFVTICTKNKEHYLGNIENNEMYLSKIGKYLANCIEEIKKHFTYAEIPLYVVMPNHIHLVVAIDSRDVARNVSLKNNNTNKDVACNVSTIGKHENETMSSISPVKGSLATVIRSLKSAVTKFANQNQISFGWQSRFHDHIIRNQDECNRIADYIENNVTLWDSDKYNQ